MEAMRSTWTDSRLDDFKSNVDTRFDKIEGQIIELGGRVDHQSDRIDALQHTMVQLFIATMVAMVTGFVTIAGLIVTQV